MAESEPKLDEKTQRSLKFSTIEGAFYNAMAGFTDYYINPFAIALGLGNSTIGFVRSLPPLLTALAQPLGLHISAFFKTRKQFVMAAVILQAAMLLVLASIPYLFKQNAELLLMMVFSLQSLLGPLANPIWASWMADLVPEKIRGRYFGNRNMVGGIATVVSIMVGGGLLNLFGQDVFLGFAVLFTFASIFRLLSFASFTKIDEPPQKFREERINIGGFLRDIRHNDYGVFLLYYSILMFATGIAGFYFSVYMIRDLQLSYTQFAIIEGFFAVSMLLSNKYWGRIIDQFGNKLVLSVCGLLVPFIPLLWMNTRSPYFLLMFETFSGFAWGGLNLAVFNYTINYGSLKNKTAQYTANFNFFQGLFVFLGAFAGAFIVESGSFLAYSGIPLVMLISGVLRLLGGLAFLPFIKEHKDVQRYQGNALWNFAFFMPARRVGFFAHEVFTFTESRAKKAVKRIKYRI
ncbi:MAG: MFS transporter [Candidatus Micrarchaeota archaeon]